MIFTVEKGVNDCTLITCEPTKSNDSLLQALDVFKLLPKNHLNTLILFTDSCSFNLSDFTEKPLNNKLYRLITIGQAKNSSYITFAELYEHYTSIDELRQASDSHPFLQENILVLQNKQTATLTYWLKKQIRQTFLEVNLDALAYNIRHFQHMLPKEAKLLVLAKAFSYGNGDYEPASVMQHLGVSYLGVAATDEGVKLREKGITMPIIVLTPETDHLEKLIAYKLEPEIHNFRSLKLLTETVSKLQLNSYPIHLKVDTGMNRQGFQEHELDDLSDYLTNNKQVKVKSLFTHLAASDEAQHDAFTNSQLANFEEISTTFEAKLGYKFMRHALNSGGVERFNGKPFDMVRMGIGIYGASTASREQTKEVATFRSVVAQLKDVAPPDTVGYGRMGKLTRKSRIAIIPVGYADGLNRRLSLGVGRFVVNNQSAPIVGYVCMDLTMVDVTDFNVREGDAVTIFGKNPSIFEVAEKLDTITYEVLTNVSARVKRVYTFTDSIFNI